VRTAGGLNTRSGFVVSSSSQRGAKVQACVLPSEHLVPVLALAFHIHPNTIMNAGPEIYRTWYWRERWRRRAKHQLRCYPLCAMCEAMGKATPATMVDHVTPHRGDWNAFIMGAVQSLCTHCHESAKKYQDHRGYSNQIGIDGWPIDPRHPVYGRTFTT
jgi:5-methylcytosine-specific restriction protein A